MKGNHELQKKESCNDDRLFLFITHVVGNFRLGGFQYFSLSAVFNKPCEPRTTD